MLAGGACNALVRNTSCLLFQTLGGNVLTSDAPKQETQINFTAHAAYRCLLLLRHWLWAKHPPSTAKAHPLRIHARLAEFEVPCDSLQLSFSLQGRDVLPLTFVFTNIRVFLWIQFISGAFHKDILDEFLHVIILGFCVMRCACSHS